MSDTIVVDSLAHHPDLVSQIVDLAWAEWGAGLTEEEHRRWVREAEADARSGSRYSAGFVALSRGTAVGTVQLHEYDIDAMRDRSPWVCGMVVAPGYRGLGIGRRLLTALEAFAAGEGVERLWVFTESASRFYKRCGWEPYVEAIQNGEPGTVLTMRVTSSSACAQMEVL